MTLATRPTQTSSASPQPHRTSPMILAVAAALVSLTLLVSAREAAALQVLACMSATPISITADPRQCSADRLLEAVATIGWNVTSGTVGISGGGGGTGQATSTFQLTKRIDRTSPTLFFDAVSGRVLPSALIVVLDDAGARIYSILLSDVTITSLVTSAAGQADGLPIDTASLAYRRVTTQFQSVQRCWDFGTNSAC